MIRALPMTTFCPLDDWLARGPLNAGEVIPYQDLPEGGVRAGWCRARTLGELEVKWEAGILVMGRLYRPGRPCLAWRSGVAPACPEELRWGYVPEVAGLPWMEYWDARDRWRIVRDPTRVDPLIPSFYRWEHASPESLLEVWLEGTRVQALRDLRHALGQLRLCRVPGGDGDG